MTRCQSVGREYRSIHRAGPGLAGEPARAGGERDRGRGGRLGRPGRRCGLDSGLEETVDRIVTAAGQSALLFVDAPLVVGNRSGQRPCETQVGQRYWRWTVSANTTNLRSPRRAGVTLRRRLEERGWRYSDGRNGPPPDGLWCCECYPYTTLVGAGELGYDLERPRYKRKPRSMPIAQWRPVRQAACDDLIQRLARLAQADPPLQLDSPHSIPAPSLGWGPMLIESLRPLSDAKIRALSGMIARPARRRELESEEPPDDVEHVQHRVEPNRAGP